GGWTTDQFADDKRPFSREELDAVLPDNPLLLQASYYETYLNSAALRVLGMDSNSSGRIEEARVREVAGKLPAAPAGEIEESTLAMIRDLNRSGLTAFGSAGCEPEILPTYRRLADQGRLTVRVFCIAGVGTGTSAEQVNRALPQIA